jgi:hypothetical protein
MEIHRPLLVDTRKACVTLTDVTVHHVVTPDYFLFYSGFGEKRHLVRLCQTHFAFMKLTPITQFLDHRRYHSLVQRRGGIACLFLL